MDEQVYDIFITHAWRYHDDWTRLSDLLDATLKSSWRNFSVPWYDPGLDPNTEVGRQRVHLWLEQQIAPTCAVILLSSVFESKSARKWILLEVEMARKYGKRIIGLPAHGAEAMMPEAAELVDLRVGWDATQIVAALPAPEPAASPLR
ncbi:TIR domain-containing protein [Desertibaculum subflavum]|uniref:TIR domain-containing protein n=1 Tax=Desertibaculum subflavum TaxID=2268458 RepID=UPI0013C5151D